MTGAAGGTWLFVRGRQSVRILRREHLDGRADLLVHGPDGEEHAYTFPSMPECMHRQAEVESALMAEGFVLQRASERRHRADRRRLTRHDRRRRDA